MQLTAPQNRMNVVGNAVYVDVTESHKLCTPRGFELNPLVPHCRSRCRSIASGSLFSETNVPKGLHEETSQAECLLKQVSPFPCRNTNKSEECFGHIKRTPGSCTTHRKVSFRCVYIVGSDQSKRLWPKVLLLLS